MPSSQFEYVSTKWYSRCGKLCPPIVIASSFMYVKSDWPNRPGTCFCAKNTSRPGTLGRPPALEVPLQRPQLPVREFARVLALQRLKQRLGFQPRVRFDLLAHLFPHPVERIVARSPVRSGNLSLGSLPSARYFLAVFASIPAFAAARSCVFSVLDNLFNLLTCGR